MEKSPLSTHIQSNKGPIQSWSYSTHMNFQKCPRMVYFDKVKKEQRPELVPPEGKDEHPLTRGTRVHDAAELYVRGECELIPELTSFAENFEVLRSFYTDPHLDMEMEEEWAFDPLWNPCGWMSADAWVRMKVDALVMNPETAEAIIIDHKTGRKHGNEIKHATQAQLYQLAAFIRYPELDTITVEFWYLDQRAISRTVYKRKFGMQFKTLFSQFGRAITNEVHFRAKPTPYSCKWCDWGRNQGTGVCTNDYYLSIAKDKKNG